MTFDERNRIHAAIEKQVTECTDMTVSTGGLGNNFDPQDVGDSWEVQVRVRISKIATGVE